MCFIEYLKLGRLPSNGFTIGILLIGFMVAGGTVFSGTGLFLVLFGIAAHFVSFTENDFFDKHLDRLDNKFWRPLVSNTIPELHAKLIIIFGSLITLWFGFLICQYNTIAILFLLLASIAGFIYNYTKSKTIYASVFAVIAYISLMIFGYLTVHDTISNLFIIVLSYFILAISYNMAYAGPYMDITTHKNNLLVALGSRIQNDYFVPNIPTRLFGWFIKGTSLIVCLYLWYVLEQSLYTIVPMAVMLSVILYFINKHTAVQQIDKRRISLNIMMMEICSYYLIFFTLAPVLSISNFLFITLYPLISYSIFNRMIWGKGYWIHARG